MEELRRENSIEEDIHVEYSEHIKESENILECTDLEENMELLELDDNKIFSNVKLKDIPVSSPRPATTNRRYSLRPQKRLETTKCDAYNVPTTKKKCVSIPKNGLLETIFENPVCKGGSITFLGKTRLRRSISFNDFVTKAKIRHRKSKVKRLCKGKVKKPVRISIDDVRLKLKCLEESTDEDECRDVIS